MKLRTSLVAGLALAALALTSGTSRALAQSSANPPERLTYQGFLVDGNGVALGNTAPKNYDVIFRIFNHETADAPANLLWGEQQTVTVDKGYFSVLLGEGAVVGNVPRPDLSTLFRGPNASDRYVGITVKGIGSGGNPDVNILPRLRLLSSPYAFLAQNAVKLVQNSGLDLMTSAGNLLTLSGSLDITGANSLEFGSDVAGKQTDAGRIGYKLFTDGLDIVGAGTAGNNRKVTIFAEGGLTVNGPLTATSFSGNGSGLSGVAKLSGGNTFSGGQIFNNNIGIGTTGLAYPLNFPDTLGDKITLWGQGASHYGFGIQNSTLQIFTDGLGSQVQFGYGGSASRTESMRIEGSGRVVAAGGFLAKGGYPGSVGVNNVGYAFTGNSGDNDSGMYSDQDGHIRFTSNSQLRMSIYPSGVYVHGGGLVVDNNLDVRTGWGRTFEVPSDYIQVLNAYDKGRAFIMYRGNTSLNLLLRGQNHLGTADRSMSFDGDNNWDYGSDRRLKKDIEDAEPMLDRALKVQLRRYRWKDDAPTSKHMLGVVAQELQPLFPDMVGEQESLGGGEKTLTVGYSDFGMIAIKALQELKVQQDAEIADLKGQMADMKAQMTELLRVNSQLLKQAEKGSTTTAAVK